MAGSVRPPGRPKCVKKMRIAPPEPKKPISVAPSPIPLARTELPAGPLLPSAPFACNTVNVTVPKSGRSKVLAEKSASECVELVCLAFLSSHLPYTVLYRCTVGVRCDCCSTFTNTASRQARSGRMERKYIYYTECSRKAVNVSRTRRRLSYCLEFTALVALPLRECIRSFASCYGNEGEALRSKHL